MAVTLASWALLIGCVFSQMTGVAACDAGWFGPRCQYKCRCASNTCNDTGVCRSGPCLGGWFGPACQYADLAYTPSSLLTDGLDNTCYQTSRNSVNVVLTKSQPFTWMRFHVSHSDFLHNLTVHMWDGNTLRCIDSKNATVDSRTLDIHCDLAETVSYVTLTGNGVQYLCSVYISGGRNVALRQSTKQSSTYSERSSETRQISVMFSSNLAVDGNPSGDFYGQNSCSHTKCFSSNDNLNVSLSLPRIVYRYVLYNRKGAQGVRLKGFTLNSFDATGTRVFNHIDSIATPQPTYTVISVHVKSPISLVDITNPYLDRCLTICEIEIYGESFCKSGKYGRDCELSCNCAESEKCFTSTGGCPSGCASGFHGDACEIPCEPGTYGQNCESTCSKFCVQHRQGERTCNHVNGTCLYGCESGYVGSTCLSACEPGIYGQNCGSACSKFCVQHEQDEITCNHVDGACLYGCESGYMELTCSSACEPGNYGHACGSVCGEFCAQHRPGERTCDHINGTCLYGCMSGYLGPSCSSVCSPIYYGPKCMSRCSGFCQSNMSDERACDHMYGDCLHGCQSGYDGPTCILPCERGKYGQACNSSCSPYCYDTNKTDESPCHHVTGFCTYGCQTGYSDASICHLDKEVKHDAAAVVVSVLGVIVIVLVIAAGFVVVRKRRNMNQDAPNGARAVMNHYDLKFS